MSKALDLIFSLQDRLEDNWKSELIRINLWDSVFELYEKFAADPIDHIKPNTILSYIILSYDKDSDWLDMDMDRLMNKEKVMKSLAGSEYKNDLDYVEAIVGTLDPYNSIIEKFLNDMPDKRYVTMMTSYEFHSRALMMANQKHALPKDMGDAGKLLTIADERFEVAENLKAIISQENVTIDTVLKKEGRKPLTDRGAVNFDFMSWEARLQERNRKRNAEKTGKRADRFDDDDEYEDDDSED